MSLKAAAAIVVIVAAYIFRPAFGAPSRISTAPVADGPAAVSEADSRRVAGRAADVSRAAGRAARSRAHARGDRPVARRGDARGRRHSAVRRRIPRGRSTTNGRPSGRIGRPTTSACRQTRRSRRGCSSFSSRSPARPRIRRRTTRRIIGCRTGRRCTCRSGICRKQKRRSGFAALRLPQNDGWTNWLVGSMRSSDCCLDAETQSRRFSRRDAGTPGHAEKMHFSAGCVAALRRRRLRATSLVRVSALSLPVFAVRRVARRCCACADCEASCAAEDRRHASSVLLLDRQRRRQPAGIRSARAAAGRHRRGRLSAAARRTSSGWPISTS